MWNNIFSIATFLNDSSSILVISFYRSHISTCCFVLFFDVTAISFFPKALSQLLPSSDLFRFLFSHTCCRQEFVSWLTFTFRKCGWFDLLFSLMVNCQFNINEMSRILVKHTCECVYEDICRDNEIIRVLN